MGKGMILLGIILVVLGAILLYAPWLLSWFGKLPGDINIKSEHGGVFIPITSMIIVSLVATLILNLLGRG